MNRITSKLKFFATLLISMVVAFLCPLNAFATSDIGYYKSLRYITSLSTETSGNITWSLYPNMYSQFFHKNGNTTNIPQNFNLGLLSSVSVKKDDIITISYWVVQEQNGEIMPGCPRSNEDTTVLECDVSISDYGKFVKSFEFNNIPIYGNDTNQAIIGYGTLQPGDYGLEGGYTYFFINTIQRANKDFTTQSFKLWTNPAIFGIGDVTVLFSPLIVHSGAASVQQVKDEMDASRQEAEQAQQQSQTDGNSSQQQANSSGQTLLGALTSFIGAVTSASPGNCSLTLNTGYGFNLGKVNLCSISPPASFQVISSLVVIGFAVPLSITASKKMIELFRGFTG